VPSTQQGTCCSQWSTKFNQQQADLLAGNIFSSTEREIYAMYVTLEIVLEQALIVFHTDNMGAYSNVMKGRGNKATFVFVRALRLLASIHDILITTEWHPREDDGSSRRATPKCRTALSGALHTQCWRALPHGTLRSLASAAMSMHVDLFATTSTSAVPGPFFSK
jgi:hypothetical protein